MGDTDDTTILSRIAARRGFWLSAGLVLVVDQLSKFIAQITLKPEGWQPGDPTPHYSFIDGLVHGTWGLGELTPQIDGPVQYVSLLLAIVFWTAVFYFVALRSGPKQWILRLGGGMMLGAAISNIAEQLITGRIRNFIKLGFDNPLWRPDVSLPEYGGFYAQRPLFSLAAVAILAGTILLVVGAMIGRPKKQASPPPPPPRPGRRPPIR